MKRVEKQPKRFNFGLVELTQNPGDEHVQREPNHVLAQDSFMWTYKKGDLSAIVSVDCPWNSWHNLNFCYTGICWDTEPTYAVPSPEGDPWPELTHSRLDMTKPDGSSGLVFFTVVDRNRNDVPPSNYAIGLSGIKQSFTDLVSRIKQSVSPTERSIEVLPATTIQVYTMKSGAYSVEARILLQSFFTTVRETILLSDRWRGR